VSIEDIRKEIDRVDEQIVKMIAGRIKIAEKIGKEKRRQGKLITDNTREIRVLDHIKDLAKQEQLSPEDAESIYRLIIASAKGSEGMKVAFQGEIGAYSEEAAFNYFGASVQTKPCEGLEDVFRIVELGEAEYGIIPIENSLEGSISLSYDLLLDSSLKVCGEKELHVVHCFIANPGATLDSLKRVYSHPQALGQSRVFLKHLNLEVIPAYDTAGSVKMIKEMGTNDVGAVASLRAAEIYGMKIITRDIADNPNNFTRFFILGKQDSPPSGNDKTSIVFSLKHKPGSLYGFLKKLADNKINLTKIESRPTRRQPWEYNFYLDFEGHREDKVPREVLAKLENYAIFMKVLGSYPKAK
jgi:chorismate mutase/prephenate dehydratase